MDKKYASLIQRSPTQDKKTVFAFFPCATVDGRTDWWSPYRPLADLAQPECWESFEGSDERRRYPAGNLAILSSYLDYTFIRIQEEDKILYSFDGEKACFNTGLLDRNYGEDIYAFFVKNTRIANDCQDWVFKTFATRSEATRSHYMDGMSGTPVVAEYYNAKNYRDLFFDLEYETIVVSKHLVEDNVDRLPKALRDNPYQAGLLISGAVDGLYAKLRRNYKLAVPHWHDGRIQLLLPLFLTNPSKADVALVAERVDDQHLYIVKTILTPDQAYRDARLICRPDSDWLIAKPTGV